MIIRDKGKLKRKKKRERKYKEMYNKRSFICFKNRRIGRKEMEEEKKMKKGIS